MKARRKSKRRRVTRDVEREFNRHMQAVLRAMREGFGTGRPTFSDAIVSLREQLAARGDTSGRLRDMACCLDEDGTAALLYALWSSDDPIYARFVLPTPTTEDAFDPEAYLKLCEHD